MSRVFPRVENLFEATKHSKPSDVVFPTGVERFDEAMDGGLREGELIVVSGPTGQGKTTFMQNLTVNYHKMEVPSLWFTHEMLPWYIKEKFRKMGMDKNLLTYIPNDDLMTTMSYMEERIKEANEDYLCKIVFIDHLHYLIPLKEAKNTPLLIGGIVRDLKKLAERTKTIIVLAAHTKKIYADEELSLNSIRDSALIANEADYVFLIERMKVEKKGKANLKDKLDDHKSDWTNMAKVQLAKNRRTGDLVYNMFQVVDQKFYQEHENIKPIKKVKEVKGKSIVSEIGKRSNSLRRELFGNDKKRKSGK